LNQVVRGWTNYFKLADAKKLIQGLDEWIRSRIRMVTWKRWKKVRTRFENLKKLGIKKNKHGCGQIQEKAIGVLPIAQFCYESLIQ
jgi:hypothetical protein